MANLNGFPEVFHSDSASEDASQQIPLGTRSLDKNGNEYVYLRGTASVVAGDWCSIFYDDYTVKRADTDEVGPLGIAGTAIGAGEFGWFQVYGLAKNANIVTGAGQAAASGPIALYLTGTAGRAGTADAAGELIEGAFQLGGVAASNVGTAWLNHPAVYNAAQD